MVIDIYINKIFGQNDFCHKNGKMRGGDELFIN